MQLQRPGLAAGAFPGLWHDWSGREWGGTQVAGICECKYLWGEIPVKSTGCPQLLCWFLQRNPAGVLCRTGYCKPWSLLQCGWYQLPCFASLFLASFIHFRFTSLWVGWIQRGSFLWCLKRLEKLVAHPSLPFAPRGTFSGWRVPRWWCLRVFFCNMIY